jgi:diphthamide synthase subunit DPH2
MEVISSRLFFGGCDGRMIDILKRHFADPIVHINRSSLLWYISPQTMRSSES